MPGRRGKRFRATAKIPVGFIGAGTRFTAELCDISTSGCLLRCSEDQVQLGGAGRLGIQVGYETMRVSAVAKRVVAGVGIGFEFNHMYPHDRELLRRLMLWISSGRSVLT
jgi:PilZ domain-containing protein